jgi:protein-S-isoprenylcysteine O-methyltransferase Ste14
MAKRLAFFVYGAIAYAIFFGTFLYAIAFVGGFLVPTQLDGPARQPLVLSLAIDAALLKVFALQHSVMARRWFKAWLMRYVSPTIERSTYVLCASLALLLMFWQWRPLGGLVWQVDHPVATAVLWTLFAAGWVLAFVTTVLISHFDLFGLRQVWMALIGKPYVPVGFVMPWLYGVVRHPLYLGFILAFWMTPAMTVTHLVFAIATTGYILIAIQFEERDLVAEHGSAYERYRQRVPMLVPGTR